MKPIVIAVAGPAGLSAAIHLRRSDFPVEVFERREDVGARFIGEYQILESYSREEDARDELAHMGIDVNFELRPAHWARLFDDRAKGSSVSSERPYGYFLRRGTEEGTLDRGLEAQLYQRLTFLDTLRMVPLRFSMAFVVARDWRSKAGSASFTTVSVSSIPSRRLPAASS